MHNEDDPLHPTFEINKYSYLRPSFFGFIEAKYQALAKTSKHLLISSTLTP